MRGLYVRAYPALPSPCVHRHAGDGRERGLSDTEDAPAPAAAESSAAEQAAERQADVAAAADASTEEAEERRKGFHCLSEWDGNHDDLEALIRERLNDPGSMETIETRIAPGGRARRPPHPTGVHG